MLRALSLSVAILAFHSCDARTTALSTLEGDFQAHAFCWSADGQQVAAIVECRHPAAVPRAGLPKDLRLCVWDAISSNLMWSKELPALNKPHENNWRSLRYSCDGNLLIATYVNLLSDGTKEETALWYDGSTGELHRQLQLAIYNGKQTPDPWGSFTVEGPGSRVLIPTRDSRAALIIDTFAHSCEIVELASGKALRPSLPLDPLALKDGSLIHTRCCCDIVDDQVMIFDTQTGHLQHTYSTVTGKVMHHPSPGLVYMPGGKVEIHVRDSGGLTSLATAEADLISTDPGEPFTIDLQSGGVATVRAKGRIHSFDSGQLSHDNKYIAIIYTTSSMYVDDKGAHYHSNLSDGFNRGLWAIWSLDKAEVVVEGNSASAVAFSPVDPILLVRDYQGRFKKVSY